ncbi:alpha/beta hydrolase [Pseudoduganella namucuonensis]|uniref:Acetyl esterase/lipase n=1 Tax=Pseudoduganella namucuonensis TaxID=1035707 RepID=A0A1I7LDZ4_9BURK|nr:alpha/beta hydrolase [Pseudoduganella namucuonensis]SFV07887.1 Acetyl esterase/lipase [Pseudoduganella namucuonensis]
MDFVQRMDRALRETYCAMPVLPDPLIDIAGARRAMLEMFGAARIGQLPSDAVLTEDRRIAGPAGAPDVAVRIYRPRHAGEGRPALLWIHGGGFTLGLPAQDDLFCEKIVETIGAVVVSVDYRLAPEHPFPAGTEDCYAALSWLFSEAPALGVDARRIAVGGASAGGGLAAGLALMARDKEEFKLAFQFLLCPCLDDRHVTPSSHEVTDDRTWSRAKSLQAWPAYLGERDHGGALAYAVPARASELKGLPPAYLMVGGLDLVRDEIIAYGARMIEAGVATELHVWPGGFHGFELFVPDAPISQAARAGYLNALQRALN